MDDLPTNYDAIIVGTGFIEAVIAAALSRVGKNVLHLDSNDYYGESWGSFNLDGIENWIKNNKKNTNNVQSKKKKEIKCVVNDNETVINIQKNLIVSNIEKNVYIKKNTSASDHKSFVPVRSNESLPKTSNHKKGVDSLTKGDIYDANCQDQLMNVARKFNLDLCPKLLYSKGPMVELLISSNVAKYAEFKSLNRVLTWRNEKLEIVPCSRADVFATKNVSVVQKRLLVKILTLFANYTDNLQEFNGFEDKSLLEFLEYKKLPDNLIHYILYAIAMGNTTTSCLEGVKSCKAFLESLGRYGNTPFIFPLYGSGELPQCFCRLSAVFGGVYCLNREIDGLIVKDNQCVGLISNGVRLNANKIIMSSAYFLENHSVLKNSNVISRGIFITNRSLARSKKEALTLLQFPPTSGVSNQPTTVIELGSGTFTCPDDFYLVHMISKPMESASSDFKHVVDSLFEIEDEESTAREESSLKPRILWSLTWNFTAGSCLKDDNVLKNIKICPGSDSELDYDLAIQRAKKIFHELYPGEEFLPRAPDPEEVILDFEEATQKTVPVYVKADPLIKETVNAGEGFFSAENDLNLSDQRECSTNKLNKS